jgi:hypothetical protein
MVEPTSLTLAEVQIGNSNIWKKLTCRERRCFFCMPLTSVTHLVIKEVA